MATLKKYAILAGKFIGTTLIGSFILSIMNYFFLTSKTIYTIGLVYLILIFLILSFKEAKTNNSRGIITGLKTGGFFILILILINLIFFQSQFKFLRLIYYLILLFSAILGAIIGINSKKE